ncbi:MAG: amidohydrolase family protein [Nitrospinales bacterium]
MKKLFFITIFLATIMLSSCGYIYDKFGGDFEGEPEELKAKLTPKAKELIDDAFKGIEPNKLLDFHTHIVGVGANGTGIYVNPEMMSFLHPYQHLQFSIYISASGIKNLDNADFEYVSRLASLIDNIPNHGRHMILAFDKFYGIDGQEDMEQTHFHVSNDYVFQLAKMRPDIFIPMISVHPYRADALSILEKWHKQGARFIKWLPNSMGIDPADKRNDSFYKKVRDLNMVLLTHTGDEGAVGEKYPEYGNPKRFEGALEIGVKIIMAHCASLGSYIDPVTGKEKSGFDIFLKMMEKYEGLLFGEISTLTQTNRYMENDALKTILKRKDLHHRLVNGSDYPLPGINFLYQTKGLADEGFISNEEKEALNLIYSYNPMLFDFVLKRTLRHPDNPKQKLPASVFMSPFPIIPIAKSIN